MTTLLVDWRRGNREAGNELVERMQPELRRIAASYMKRERAGHTLQPTALVNELYLKLMGTAAVAWQDRAHFSCGGVATDAPDFGGSCAPTPGGKARRRRSPERDAGRRIGG